MASLLLRTALIGAVITTTVFGTAVLGRHVTTHEGHQLRELRCLSPHVHFNEPAPTRPPSVGFNRFAPGGRAIRPAC